MTSIFSLVDALPGGSRLIHGLGQVQAKLWRGFPSRWLNEAIFDQYAASRLRGSSGIFIATPGLVRTARKAKNFGYTTFLYGGHSDPAFLLQQIQIERSAFGLKTTNQNKSRSWEMARFAAHIDTSDYILAISEFAANTYVQHGFPAEKIFIVPLGVDLGQVFRHAAAFRQRFHVSVHGSCERQYGYIKGPAVSITGMG